MHHCAYFTDYLHFSPYDCDLHYFQILRWFTWLFSFFIWFRKHQFLWTSLPCSSPHLNILLWADLGLEVSYMRMFCIKKTIDIATYFNFINVYVSKVILYVAYCIPWGKYSDWGFAGSLLRMLLGTTPVTAWRN